jgi:hypothetical protein
MMLMFRDTMTEWILRADGALCLSGYAIRIRPNRLGADMARLPFLVASDWDLEDAKRVAKKLAREIDAFTMPDTPEGISQFEDARAPAKTRAKVPAQPSAKAKVAERVK